MKRTHYMTYDDYSDIIDMATVYGLAEGEVRKILKVLKSESPQPKDSTNRIHNIERRVQ